MEFKNGYNLIYEKAHKIFASKTHKPELEDEAIDFGLTEAEIANIKLIYENKDGLVASFKNIPTADDLEIRAMSRGEEVFGPAGGNIPRVLKQFKIGQAIIGYDFGEVKNGDINLELDEFLLSLPEGDSVAFVLGSSERFALYGVHVPNSDVAIIFTWDSNDLPLILYSTWTGEFEGIQLTHGYSNLDDGILMVAPYVVNELNYNITDTSWNGKFMGAITTDKNIFTEGMTIKAGDKIHFDITKEAYLLEHLRNIDWDLAIITYLFYPMVADLSNYPSEFKLPLFAMKAPDSDDKFFVFAGNTDMSSIVYSSFAAPEENIKAGFQNLDADNCITIHTNNDGRPGYIEANLLPITVSIVADTAKPHWNGNIIDYIPGTIPVPSLTPFENGQVIHSYDKFKFDRNADMDSWLASLHYTAGSEGNSFAILMAGSSDVQMIAATNNNIYALSICGRPIYVSDDIPEAELTRGWQEIVNEAGEVNAGDVGVTDQSTIVLIDDDGPWNGFIVGYEAGTPVVTINAFENNMLIRDIPNIHLDTTNEAGIFEMFNNLNWEQSQTTEQWGCIMVRFNSTIVSGMPILLAVKVPEDNFYGLCTYNNEVGFVPLYGNKEYTYTYILVPGSTTEVYFAGGFQNLDSDGNTTAYKQILEQYPDAYISEIDSQGNWNGILIGYVGELPPAPVTPLTPFTAGDSLYAGDMVQFNTSISNDDIVNYLSTLEYDPESYSAILLNTTLVNSAGETISGQSVRISAVSYNQGYVLMVADGFGTPGVVWSYDASQGEGGWHIGTDYYTIQADTDVYGQPYHYENISLNSSASGWNGMFIGITKA